MMQAGSSIFHLAYNSAPAVRIRLCETLVIGGARRIARQAVL